MLHLNGEMVSYGDGGLRLFYYAQEAFGDFTLRLQFRIFDAGEPQQRRIRPLPAPDARPDRGAPKARLAATIARTFLRSGKSRLETRDCWF